VMKGARRLLPSLQKNSFFELCLNISVLKQI
jgi:hypothetical protein